MPSTVPYDHPSVHNVQTPSGVKRHKANATGEVASRQALKVSHQKVNIELDFANQVITGETEIIISPLEQNLKQVKLDSRNIQINEVFVNNKRATFKYKDFHRNDEFLNDPENYYVRDLTPQNTFNGDFKFNPHYDLNSKNFDVHQHHLYKGNFHPTYGNTNHLDELNINTDPQQVQLNYHHPYTPLLLTNTEELIIDFPEGVRLRPHNNSVSHFSPSKSNHATPFSSANTVNNQEQLYTPVYIRISYTVRNPKNGILFNGGLSTKVPKDEWFCYTSNNDVNFSASCWVPCIDNFYEKTTWDINLSVPKTIGDIGDSKIIGTKAADAAMKKKQREENGDYDDEDEDMEEYLKRDIVVASPELLNYLEIPHTTDFSKKIISFQLYNPIAPQHVGFALGPFEKLSMSGFNDEVKEQELDKAEASSSFTNVPADIYYLPDRKSDVINTCMFLYKAMDFYSKEFGSFPFNSYTIVFLKEFPSLSCGFAGLSLVSDKVLYSTDKVDPMISSTELLSKILAEQWAGINVVPKTHNDIWCVVGIAEFMASQFSKKIFGLNEFKYRNKLKSDLVCEQDIRKRPLANQFFRFPINDNTDFQFMKLKSSLVMIILDHRMTKTDKSFGLSRVIPKLFLQAMSGDLFNGNCLSTYHFKHVCEKVNHSKLDNFFKNWVYSSGTPVLRFSQRFNKKRMVIELTVRQVQVQELNTRNDDGMLCSGLSSESRHADDNFINDSVNFLENDDSEFNVPSIFQGPMTIRVHEADGTPYEHIVELKDGVSKLDIPYNTKYRRLRRGRRKQVDMLMDEDGEDLKMSKDNLEEVRINCFADVLQSPEEMREWNLQDWSKEDEENLNNESFEWIRVDADFEWICKVHFNQPDYMYYSQLQQDRDVEAQIDSVRFFSNALKPTDFYSSILTKTLMDKRYFYGVRVEAVIGLAKLAKEELSFVGLRHLLKCYQLLYCYKTKYDILAPINEKNYLPLPNNFENIGDLFILETIPKALASIKLSSGEVPLEIRKILLNMLKFNDNLSNKFDDGFYIVNIIEAIFTSICNSGGFLVDVSENADLEQFMNDVATELKRILKLDEFLPSFNHIVTSQILRQKIKAAKSGFFDISIKELLSYTSPSLNNELRLVAVEGLLHLGGLKNSDIMHYYFTVLKIDDSARVKLQMISTLMRAIAIAAIHGTPSLIDDPEFDEVYFLTLEQEAGDKNSGIVFIEDGSNKMQMNSRRDAFARATISGAIEILRRDYAFGKGLKKEIWTAVHSNLLSIHGKRDLFDICEVLYEARNSFVVTVDRPNEKKIVAKVGKVDITNPDVKVYEILVQRKGRLKIQLPSFIDKKKQKKATKIKTENGQLATPTAKIKLTKPLVVAKPAAPGKVANGDLPAPPTAAELPPATIAKKATSKIVSLKFKSKESIEKLKNHSMVKMETQKHVAITRSASHLPLRFVKISTKLEVRLEISTDPFVLSEPNGNSETPTISKETMLAMDKNMESETPSIKIRIKHEKLKMVSLEPSEQETSVVEEIVPKVEEDNAVPDKILEKEPSDPPDEPSIPAIEDTPKVEVKKEASPKPIVRPKIKLKINFDKNKK